MADDGVRVILANPHTSPAEDFRRRLPWLMQPLAGKPCEFGTPMPDVIAVRIELFTLADRIEHTKVRRGIRATTRCPLPTERVLRQVGVHECVPEPPRALCP